MDVSGAASIVDMKLLWKALAEEFSAPNKCAMLAQAAREPIEALHVQYSAKSVKDVLNAFIANAGVG